MQTPYVEVDCTIAHDGRTFEAGGAVVTDEYAIGYFKQVLKRHGFITTWHGEVMGPATIKSSWPMSHSFISDRQYQVEATIDGRVYTGRTMGDGMIWRGKRKKGH